MSPIPLLVAAALLLFAAPAADAMIQVNRGIAGARLGNSKAQVKAALGKPAKVKISSRDFLRIREYRFRGGIRVFFVGDEDVTSVETTGLGDRTATGIGVGSEEAAVKRKVPGVRCETIEASRFCETGDTSEAGERGTRFYIKKGRVSRVSVVFVIP